MEPLRCISETLRNTGKSYWLSQEQPKPQQDKPGKPRQVPEAAGIQKGRQRLLSPQTDTLTLEEP